MAVKYKLVTKKNLGEDQKEVPQKVYAQMVCGDKVAFAQFIDEVSDSSGVGSAGTKAVLDRINVVLVRHLQLGQSVDAGELGHFRFTFGSGGALDAKTFETNLLREPKVRFFPGKALREVKARTAFERVGKTSTTIPEGGEGENPDENPDIL